MEEIIVGALIGASVVAVGKGICGGLKNGIKYVIKAGIKTGFFINSGAKGIFKRENKFRDIDETDVTIKEVISEVVSEESGVTVMTVVSENIELAAGNGPVKAMDVEEKNIVSEVMEDVITVAAVSIRKTDVLDAKMNNEKSAVAVSALEMTEENEECSEKKYVIFKEKADSVSIAGEWNEWCRSNIDEIDEKLHKMEKKNDNNWVFSIKDIKPGKHEYKFLINGIWEEGPNRIMYINTTRKIYQLGIFKNDKYEYRFV